MHRGGGTWESAHEEHTVRPLTEKVAWSSQHAVVRSVCEGLASAANAETLVFLTSPSPVVPSVSDCQLAHQMRSILLVAEMSVLGKLGDSVAAQSLVTGRESDFLRCSSNLLRYCVQVGVCR